MLACAFAEDGPQSVGPEEVAGDGASRMGVRALHARPEPVHRGEVEPLQRKPRVVHSRLEPLVASVAREDHLATVFGGMPRQERIGGIPEVHHRRGTRRAHLERVRQKPIRAYGVADGDDLLRKPEPRRNRSLRALFVRVGMLEDQRERQKRPGVLIAELFLCKRSNADRIEPAAQVDRRPVRLEDSG